MLVTFIIPPVFPPVFPPPSSSGGSSSVISSHLAVRVKLLVIFELKLNSSPFKYQPTKRYPSLVGASGSITLPFSPTFLLLISFPPLELKVTVYNSPSTSKIVRVASIASVLLP